MLPNGCYKFKARVSHLITLYFSTLISIITPLLNCYFCVLSIGQLFIVWDSVIFNWKSYLSLPLSLSFSYFVVFSFLFEYDCRMLAEIYCKQYSNNAVSSTYTAAFVYCKCRQTTYIQFRSKNRSLWYICYYLGFCPDVVLLLLYGWDLHLHAGILCVPTLLPTYLITGPPTMD